MCRIRGRVGTVGAGHAKQRASHLLWDRRLPSSRPLPTCVAANPCRRAAWLEGPTATPAGGGVVMDRTCVVAGGGAIGGVVLLERNSLPSPADANGGVRVSTHHTACAS